MRGCSLPPTHANEHQERWADPLVYGHAPTTLGNVDDQNPHLYTTDSVSTAPVTETRMTSSRTRHNADTVRHGDKDETQQEDSEEIQGWNNFPGACCHFLS